MNTASKSKIFKMVFSGANPIIPWLSSMRYPYSPLSTIIGLKRRSCVVSVLGTVKTSLNNCDSTHWTADLGLHFDGVTLNASFFLDLKLRHRRQPICILGSPGQSEACTSTSASSSCESGRWKG